MLFHFKQFKVDDAGCGMKICSDSVLLASWFLPKYPEAKIIVDVGTGSGVLALMAAQVCHQAQIMALEIDESAAAAAKFNFRNSPWCDRLDLFCGNFADYEPCDKVDLIISNPPYFRNGETAPDKLRAAARHQSELGYSSLLAYAARNLAPDGHLGMVSPSEAYDDILFAAELAGLKLRGVCKVKTSQRKDFTRILWDFALNDGFIEETQLSIRINGNEYSPEYIELVNPYYTKI